ncbi:MAG: hypothetical protein V2J02_11490 [Pseudomonadales bacterium]|nr:hypothetical protein [Pseudomonadales bacterium]
MQRWIAGLGVLAVLAGCGGGSSGSGSAGGDGSGGDVDLTFARVLGGDAESTFPAVFPVDDGYRVVSGLGGQLSFATLDRDGSLLRAPELFSRSRVLRDTAPAERIPDGFLSADVTLNRTANAYFIGLRRLRFGATADEAPTELWARFEEVSYADTLWSSDEADFTGRPASIQRVDILHSAAIVSTDDTVLGAYLVIAEVAVVETGRGTRQRRERLLVRRYDASGQLLSIRRVIEGESPIFLGSALIFLGSSWFAVGRDGGYVLVLPDSQNPEDAYDILRVDRFDGRAWRRTLDLPQAPRFVQPLGLDEVLLSTGQELLRLDGSGSTRWKRSLPQGRVAGLACADEDACVFGWLRQRSTNEVVLVDEEGSDLGPFDVDCPFVVSMFTSLAAWGTDRYRLAVEGPFLCAFELDLEGSPALVDLGTQPWDSAGRSWGIELTRHGAVFVDNRNGVVAASDLAGRTLFDAGNSSFSVDAPFFVAPLPEGRFLVTTGGDEVTLLDQSGPVRGFFDDASFTFVEDVLPFASGTQAVFAFSDLNFRNTSFEAHGIDGGFNWRVELEGVDDPGRVEVKDAVELSDGTLVFLLLHLTGGGLGGTTLQTPVERRLVALRFDPRAREVLWFHAWSLRMSDDLRSFDFGASMRAAARDAGIGERVVVAIDLDRRDSAFSLLELDENGVLAAALDLAPLGAGGEVLEAPLSNTFALSSAPDGTLWLGYTSSALVSRSTLTTESGELRSAPFGGNNLALLRLGSDLRPELLRVYGAGGDERLNTLLALQDGGVLVSGETTSFALAWSGDPGNAPAVEDSWLLRLDAAGRVAEQCQALLEELDGPAAAARMGAAAAPLPIRDEAFEGTLSFTVITDPATAHFSATPLSRVSSPEPYEEGRVCTGTVIDPPVADAPEPEPPEPEPPTPPPGSGDFTLTVTLEGGPGAGEVQVFEGDTPVFDCINSAEPTTVCTRAFPAGTMLELQAQAFRIGDGVRWTGCDFSADEDFFCSLTMDADRSAQAVFGP